MRAHVNSTGRKRIEGRHARLGLRPVSGGSGHTVEARFALDELRLSPNGRIVVEAYRQGFAERFDFGTVAAPRPSCEPRLQELAPEGLLFRVKVVEPGTARLLALARELRPAREREDENPRRELFRVKKADLGQELWRVEMAEGEAPALVLNSLLPGVEARLREPELRAAVLPAAMRIVLLHLWTTRAEQNQDGDMDDWTQRWLDFAERFADAEKPSPDDDRLAAAVEWIDRACAGFAEFFRLADGLVQADAEEAV